MFAFRRRERDGLGKVMTTNRPTVRGEIESRRRWCAVRAFAIAYTAWQGVGRRRISLNEGEPGRYHSSGERKAKKLPNTATGSCGCHPSATSACAIPWNDGAGPRWSHAKPATAAHATIAATTVRLARGGAKTAAASAIATKAPIPIMFLIA